MDIKYLNSCLQDVTFYFLKNNSLLTGDSKDLIFKIKVRNDSKKDINAILELYRKKNIIETFKLSSTIEIYKQEYVLEINLYLVRLYKELSRFILERNYLHICPECNKIHSNNSMHFSKNYLCNECLNLYNNYDPEKPKIACGYIYFFESTLTGLIKIGYSGNVKSRKKQIQNMQGGEINVLKTILSPQKNERYLHERFSHIRSIGEWFQPTSELLEYIKNLNNKSLMEELS